MHNLRLGYFQKSYHSHFKDSLSINPSFGNNVNRKKLTALTYLTEGLCKENLRKIPKYCGKYIHIDMLAIFLYT